MTEGSTAIKRSKLTRALHCLTALAIVTQLVLSLVMQSPGRNQPGDTYFEIHEKVGIATTAILLAFWIWSLLRSGETRIVAFYPWFSRRHLALVLADARNVFGPVHGSGRERPFASAVHGLGLLVATAMAVTGLLGYFFASARFLLGVHEAVAPLMWAYLIGHVAISIVHELRGERIIGPMVWLADRD